MYGIKRKKRTSSEKKYQPISGVYAKNCGGGARLSSRRKGKFVKRRAKVGNRGNIGVESYLGRKKGRSFN